MDTTYKTCKSKSEANERLLEIAEDGIKLTKAIMKDMPNNKYTKPGKDGVKNLVNTFPDFIDGLKDEDTNAKYEYLLQNRMQILQIIGALLNLYGEWVKEDDMDNFIAYYEDYTTYQQTFIRQAEITEELGKIRESKNKMAQKASLAPADKPSSKKKAKK